MVTDPTGAIVQGAKVEINSSVTGVKFDTEANSSGVYTIPGVPYGEYQMTVTAPGFGTYTRPIVEIATGTTVNVVLNVGDLSQQVSVEATAIVLESTTSSLGTGVDEKLKSDLPNLINQGMRSPFSYIYVAPTVNPIRQVTIGGSRGGGLDVLVDGQTTDIDTNSMGNNGAGLPSVEAIGEFKMNLNSIPAEYGRSSGAAISYASKSGTNTYHGVGFEYLRNNLLDARPWQAATRDIYKQNEYGFAGGGPVIIPKLYNGKNKTFIWGNFTGYKYRTLAATNITTLPTAAERTGDFWASFILGYPDYAVDAQAQAYGIRESYFAPFIQDDWRISRKLTLNMGLRWDINVPYTELQGREATFNPNEPNPGATGELGGVAFYGYGPGRLNSNRVGKIDWHELGPRFGLAYQIDPKTVLRAFFGIVDVGIQNGNADFADRSGYYALGQIPPPSNPAGIAYNWSNPFPSNLFGTTPNLDPTLKNGQTETYQDPLSIGRTPQLYMWSGSFQRELKGNILVEVAYLANNSKHDSDHLYPDTLPPQYWSLGQSLLQPLNSAAVQSLPAVQALPMQAGGIRSPYPQFSYNAGYIKFQKRFTAGLTFLANYTISKYLSDNMWSPGTYGSIARDYYDRRLYKELRMGNEPQRLVLSYSYELPFGSGKKFFSGSGRIGNAILGGWTVSAIQQYEDGEPAITDGYLSIPVPTTPSVTTTGSHADRHLGVPVRSSTSCGSLQFGGSTSPKNYIFNAGNAAEAAAVGLPLAYIPEGDFQIGNTPDVDPHAKQCPIFNEDVSIAKDFPIVERARIRFGADFFNILNRHSWESGNGGQDVSSASFGLAIPWQINSPRIVQMHVRVEF